MGHCKLGQLIAADSQAAELAAVGPTRAAAKALRAAGFEVGATSVADHRAGRCVCRRPDVAVIVAPPADVPETGRPVHEKPPAGWSPRAEYDTAEGGFIVSAPWADGEPEPSEVELLAERGMDPARWTVTSVRYSDWQQSKRLDNGDRDVITLHAKRVNIAPCRRGTGVPDGDLVKLFQQKRSRARQRHTGGGGAPGVFVHAGGDYQLGKTDGDGVDGTVGRFMDALDFGADRLAWLRSRHPVSELVLPHLGDCIEGYVSQGGRNAHRTTLATSEQVDLLIHLLTEQVAHYAPLAPRVVVPIIPGNHDEEGRNPDSLEHHSWAVFAAKQLRRVLRAAGDRYDHVRIVTPKPGELTLTLDLAGVPVGFGHGHYHGPGKLHDWLDGQAGGMQLVGEARIMWEAHHHHFAVSQRGIRTGIQIPALEGESRWWRHRTGQQSPPGMVTALVGERLGRPVRFRDGKAVRTGWDHLAVA